MSRLRPTHLTHVIVPWAHGWDCGRKGIVPPLIDGCDETVLVAGELYEALARAKVRVCDAAGVPVLWSAREITPEMTRATQLGPMWVDCESLVKWSKTR